MDQRDRAVERVVEEVAMSMGVPLRLVIGVTHGEPREPVSYDEVAVWRHGLEQGMRTTEARFFHPWRYRRHWMGRMGPHIRKCFPPHPYHSIDA